MTRGEEILHLNQAFMARMAGIDMVRNPEKALQAHAAYTHRRGSTYMHYAQPGSPTPEAADQAAADWIDQPAGEEGKGYAGVVLDIVEAFATGVPLVTGLNIPNEGMITAMRPTDVVEISAKVDSTGISPLPIGAIPESQELLMRSVKHYERLTVEAIQARSRKIARAALMAHPLVQSYSRAGLLVDDYLKAHAPFIGDWS
jgi:6-phospho-beta-glucosidase